MRGGVSLLLLGCLVTATNSLRCDRTPEGFVAPKSPADNRFQLKISGSPEKYVPGEGYTVSLVGQRSPGHSQVAQKFTGFSLVVEPQNYSPLTVMSARDITQKPIGLFTLYGDSMTKFSTSCPNMVTHTSSMPKTEVQVRWTAPPPGSGCVIFRATVMEHRDVWYQDDGPLTKILCEEIQENLDLQPLIMDHCCACEEAKYEVTFEGLWSRHTHPKDFPSNSWLTRFSDIIGASHSPHYKFWEYGGFATEGLRQVAERGSTRVLESELKSHSSEIRTIIKARGISYPNVTGKTFAVFRVNKHHHLMSLVSMIDPSPDWIVGVSALELCLKNCSWIESKILNLYPWDAGTDSGVTYISPDQKTFPVEKIRRLTSSFPNDPRSPFYDPSGLEMKPLARLYLTRQRLYEKNCQNGQSAADACALTEWSAWSPCSPPCGAGKQTRRKDFKYSGKDCPSVRQVETRSCVARHCRPLAQPVQETEEDPYCDIGKWSEWSECTPVDGSCKRGIQTHFRQVKPKGRAKYCLKYPTIQERKCQLNMDPSDCPKGKILKEEEEEENENVEGGPEEDLYGNEENNNTEDQDFPDENGREENGGEENGGEENGGEENGGEENGNNINGEEENGDSDREGNNDGGTEVNGDGEGAGENDGEGEGVEEENGNDEGVGEENGEEGKEENEDNGGGGGEENEENDNGNGEHGERNDIEGNGDGEEEHDNGIRNLIHNRDNAEENEVDNYDNGGDEENAMQPEEPSGDCEMNQWSQWTPCSVSCGLGVKKRTRELYGSDGPRVEYQRAPPPEEGDYGTYDDETEAEYAEEPCSKYKVLEVEPCNGSLHSCHLSPEDANGQEDDQATTEEPPTGDEELVVLGQTKDHYGEPVMGTDRPVRDCKFSRWSPWSECHAPCNQHGTKMRTRNIEVHAKNGGKACIGKMKKEKKCFRRCRDNEGGHEGEDREEDKRNNRRCKYDEWASWTECTATCGLSAIRQRTRQILSGNPTECTDRVHRQHCNVGPCPH